MALCARGRKHVGAALECSLGIGEGFVLVSIAARCCDMWCCCVGGFQVVVPCPFGSKESGAADAVWLLPPVGMTRRMRREVTRSPRHVAGIGVRRQSHAVWLAASLARALGLGGRGRAPGKSLALRCRRRRRPRVSLSFLIASFESCDPLPTRCLKTLRVKTLAPQERAAATFASLPCWRRRIRVLLALAVL